MPVVIHLELEGHRAEAVEVHHRPIAGNKGGANGIRWSGGNLAQLKQHPVDHPRGNRRHTLDAGIVPGRAAVRLVERQPAVLQQGGAHGIADQVIGPLQPGFDIHHHTEKNMVFFRGYRARIIAGAKGPRLHSGTFGNIDRAAIKRIAFGWIGPVERVIDLGIDRRCRHGDGLRRIIDPAPGGNLRRSCHQVGGKSVQRIGSPSAENGVKSRRAEIDRRIKHIVTDHRIAAVGNLAPEQYGNRRYVGRRSTGAEESARKAAGAGHRHPVNSGDVRLGAGLRRRNADGGRPLRGITADVIIAGILGADRPDGDRLLHRGMAEHRVCRLEIVGIDRTVILRINKHFQSFCISGEFAHHQGKIARSDRRGLVGEHLQGVIVAILPRLAAGHDRPAGKAEQEQIVIVVRGAEGIVPLQNRAQIAAIGNVDIKMRRMGAPFIKIVNGGISQQWEKIALIMVLPVIAGRFNIHQVVGAQHRCQMGRHRSVFEKRLGDPADIVANDRAA